ncbi:MAG: hypothetical protein ACOCX1_02005 [Fimbriimonadaceae bacterium]
MRVKHVTGILFAAGFLLLLRLLQLLYDRPPETAPRDVIVDYTRWLLIYFALTSFTFLGAALASVLWARSAKNEFLKANKENLRDLIEGSLKDHGRKKND